MKQIAVIGVGYVGLVTAACFSDLGNNVVAMDISEEKIRNYYDYEYKNQNDDFLPTIKKILAYDLILFITPVYWYSMSGIMKTTSITSITTR